MKSVLLTLLMFTGAVQALADGELSFTIAGKHYSTAGAQAVIENKGGKRRLLIAVKDKAQKFLLVFTAMLANGDETRAQTLNTSSSELSLNLRTMQGTFAVLPAFQMATGTGIAYSESIAVESGELEDDPNHKPQAHDSRDFKRRKRKKIRQEYRRTEPHWKKLSRKERIERGEGVIQNAAFKDTYFTLQFTPVLSQGKVVSYEGTFSGTGRFARESGTSEVKPVQGGQFKVLVQYAN